MRNLSIEKQREISAATETVWNVLTNPDFIKQWLGVTVNTDWNVGCSITFSFTWDGTEYEDKGHILEYEPQSVFSYDYWSGFSALGFLRKLFNNLYRFFPVFIRMLIHRWRSKVAMF